MLHSIKSLQRMKLGALDGKVGHVADCYFDDKNWALRYFAADMDWWQTPRRVVLSPHAFAPIPEHGRALRVYLTREQIEKSPSLGLKDAVTRNFETEYYQYFNWPFYWQGDFLWGPDGSPDRVQPAGLAIADRANPGPAHVLPSAPKPDPNLRSALAVVGLPVYSGDDVVGRVTDLLTDENNWRIRYLAIKVGHWFSGRILLSTRKVSSIDWERSRVVVTPTREAIERAAARRAPRGHISPYEALATISR